MNSKLKNALEILSAILSGVVPWVDRLLPLQLIGAYYRPYVEILATFLAVCAFAVRLFTFRGVPALAPKKKWAIGSFVVLVVSCLVCLLVSMTLGETFDPGPGWTEVIRIAWCAVYVIAAISLAVMLASLMQLIP